MSVLILLRTAISACAISVWNLFIPLSIMFFSLKLSLTWPEELNWNSSIPTLKNTLTALALQLAPDTTISIRIGNAHHINLNLSFPIFLIINPSKLSVHSNNHNTSNTSDPSWRDCRTYWPALVLIIAGLDLNINWIECHADFIYKTK